MMMIMMAGIVMHELMHTAGFWHEQSRADRDKYITVHWDNIKPGWKSNFLKYDLGKIDHLGAPYDLCSVMHYGAFAFTKVMTIMLMTDSGKSFHSRRAADQPSRPRGRSRVSWDRGRVCLILT